MKHARADYNRIQDPEHKIPEDEPVFLLRGQDKAAPETVRFWASQALKHNAHPRIIALAMMQAEKMEKWQKEHVGKTPDLPQ